MEMARGLDVPGSLSILVVLGTILASLYLARALGRRRRRDLRREGRSLKRLFAGYLRGQVTAETLVAVTRRTQEDPFWSALERLSLALDARDRKRLSRALARDPHAGEERRRLRDDSPWRRELSARRLGLLDSAASRRALRRALRQGPEPVTLVAGLSLARHRDLTALRWLLMHPARLAHRPPRSVMALLGAFGRRGLPEVAAALERGIAEPLVELAAMDVLGAGGYRGARDRLERLLTDGSLEHRITAARALGRLQAVECATPLIAALHDDAWQVRAQAARALGRARAPVAIAALAHRLTDPSWWVRHHAAYALGEMGVEGRATLRRIAETSPDPYARDMALEVLEGGIRFDVA